MTSEWAAYSAAYERARTFACPVICAVCAAPLGSYPILQMEDPLCSEECLDTWQKVEVLKGRRIRRQVKGGGLYGIRMKVWVHSRGANGKINNGYVLDG